MSEKIKGYSDLHRALNYAEESGAYSTEEHTVGDTVLTAKTKGGWGTTKILNVKSETDGRVSLARVRGWSNGDEMGTHTINTQDVIPVGETKVAITTQIANPLDNALSYDYGNPNMDEIRLDESNEVRIAHTHEDGTVTVNNLTGWRNERAQQIIAGRAARLIGRALVAKSRDIADKQEF